MLGDFLSSKLGFSNEIVVLSDVLVELRDLLFELVFASFFGKLALRGIFELISLSK